MTKTEETKDSKLFSILNSHKDQGIERIKPYFEDCKYPVKYFDDELIEYYMNYKYEKASIEALSSQSIIFFDPDIGIEVQSTVNRNKYEYVSYNLLCRYWELNKSIIIYQHGDRSIYKTKEKIKILFDILPNLEKDNVKVFTCNGIKYICLVNSRNENFGNVIMLDIFEDLDKCYKKMIIV
ncbi:conserved hypothetical protein [Leadbettera azotonutricia ZAS-9]|uniref:Uncharacterized protein n=1 Tax=Leadbettera azotonutricia (strain ATCC BAA-888 / DSM 13862 / ZAS-9) TaxID=545695 RepID=F5Y9M1_LEAAZ|nr:conserved hypothetical protein [Leadbettera azotonutricia ZAS-9]